MTYCLALRLHEGMLFLADTRTNAGVDNVGTYRKMHVLQPMPAPPPGANAPPAVPSHWQLVDLTKSEDPLKVAGDCELIEQIERLWQLSGGFGTFLVWTHDWADRAATRRSFELFARHVMPAFR